MWCCRVAHPPTPPTHPPTQPPDRLLFIRSLKIAGYTCSGRRRHLDSVSLLLLPLKMPWSLLLWLNPLSQNLQATKRPLCSFLFHDSFPHPPVPLSLPSHSAPSLSVSVLLSSAPTSSKQRAQARGRSQSRNRSHSRRKPQRAKLCIQQKILSDTFFFSSGRPRQGSFFFQRVPGSGPGAVALAGAFFLSLPAFLRLVKTGQARKLASGER